MCRGTWGSMGKRWGTPCCQIYIPMGLKEPFPNASPAMILLAASAEAFMRLIRGQGGLIFLCYDDKFYSTYYSGDDYPLHTILLG